jgi:hypothetical protein
LAKVDEKFASDPAHHSRGHDHRDAVGEDPNDLGAVTDLFVQSLLRVLKLI